MRSDRIDVFPYYDEDGRKVFQRVRWEPKQFTYEHGSGPGWLIPIEDQRFQALHGKLASDKRDDFIMPGKPSTCKDCKAYAEELDHDPGAPIHKLLLLSEATMFNLPHLLDGLQEDAENVWVTEGESDAEAMAEATGEVCTTHPRAVGGPSPQHLAWFVGYEGLVVVVKDNDDAGSYGALKWLQGLDSIGVNACVVQPPGEYNDLRQYLESEPPTEDGALELNLVGVSIQELQTGAEKHRKSGGSGSGYWDNEPLGTWVPQKEFSAPESVVSLEVQKDVVPKPETFDDQGNAGLLLRFYHEDVRFMRDRNVWAAWDYERELWIVGDDAVGRKWDDVSRRMYRLFRKKYMPLIGDDAANPADRSEAKAFGQHVKYSRGESGMRNALNAASRRTQVIARITDFDPDPQIIACENTILKLSKRGGVISQRDGREHYITMTTGVAYKDSAWGGDGCGSDWDKFLNRVLPDEDVRAFLQRLVGYSLLGENVERKVVCVLGPTSSGKTTFAEIVRVVLGDYASTMPGSVLRDNQDERPRADIVSVLRRRFVVSEEVSGAWHLHNDQIKRLSGDGAVSVRVPYGKESVVAVPAFTAWFLSNDPPTIKDADEALWRRLVVLPFKQSLHPDEVDPHFKGKMLASLERREEIMAWAVQGWARYVADGLAIPESILEDQLRFREEVSDFDRWMRDRCKRGSDQKEPAATLYDDYWDWCDTGNIPQRERMSSVAFGRRLTGAGVGRVPGRDDSGRMIKFRTGIALRKRGVS